MDTKVVNPAARRTRRRHTAEFKAQVIEACLQPGISVAAVALANGLNANYLRRWVKEHREQMAGSRIAVPVVASDRPAMLYRSKWKLLSRPSVSRYVSTSGEAEWRYRVSAQ